MRSAGFAIVLPWLLLALNAFAGTPSITITEIQRDVRITGKVDGIPKDDLPRHKVVVYVQTDRWYIHPFADGGDGKSWASVHTDGSWKIGTVKRDFPAKSVAAAVVPRDYNAPPRLEDLGVLPASAVFVKPLQGQKEYGDL